MGSAARFWHCWRSVQLTPKRVGRGGVIGVGLAIGVAAAVPACVVTRDSEGSGDSVQTVVVRLDTMPPPATAVSVTPATAVPRGPRAPSSTPVADPMGDLSARDSNATTPSAAELRALSAEMIMPLTGVRAEDLVDTFHEPRGGGTRVHEALDILSPRGTPVLSSTTGRVLRLHTSQAGGLMVYAADSTERFVLMYAHLDRYADGMRDGLPLRRGQVLGYVGTTGNAPPNTPHLHFAIAYPRDVSLWWTGTAVDPRPLLQERYSAR